MSPPWSLTYLEAVVTKSDKTNSDFKSNMKVIGIILKAPAFPEKFGSHKP